MTREASAFLAAVKWDEEAFEPTEFVQIHSLPQVAKSIKCRSNSSSSKKHHHHEECPLVPLNQPILWLNVIRSTRIIAQPVKFRHNLPPVPCGSKVSLDHNFLGWFEILSEDGCTSKCMESVLEVTKRKPERFLLRQKVKCFLTSNPESLSPVLLPSGEILTFVSTEKFRPDSSHPPSYLRCLTQSGLPVLLSLETKGKFSQVAGPENISGVHSLHNLIRGKRMPLMVRLVMTCGSLGGKNSSLNRDIKDLRLQQVVHEDFLMGINLMKETDKFIQLPLDSRTRLMPPSNTSFLTSLPEYKTLVHRYIRSPPSSDSGHSSPSWPTTRWDQNLNLVSEKLINHQRSNEKLFSRSRHDENHCPDSDYDDIDQLYDYVRGLAPLPPSSKKKFSSKVNFSICLEPQPLPEERPRAWNRIKEEPIYESLKHKSKDNETVVSGIGSNGKSCNSNGGGHRIYVKSPTALLGHNNRNSNGKSCGNCLIRKNSDNGTRTRSSLSSSSPLFAIRYKSLTELPQVSSNPIGDPTTSQVPDCHLILESNNNNSTGRETSHSSSSKVDFHSLLLKVPKAKNRKLSKQLSLSNLFRLATATTNRPEADHLTIRSESPAKSRVPLLHSQVESPLKQSQSRKSLGTLYM